MNFPLPHWPLLIQATGWTLLHFIWQGAAIGLGYAMARLIVPAQRSEARYAVGVGALALLALSPLATFAIEYSKAVAIAAMVMPDALAASAPGDLLPVTVTQGLSLDACLPWLVLAWTVGVIAMSWRAWHQWCAIARIAKRHSQASPELEELLAVLARKFGLLRKLCVLVSDHIDTPTLIGWLKPVVLLPTAVALGFPRQQLELILAHELGHLRRYDHLVNLAQAVVETLLFYHPVVHWISTEVRNEREICCDRLVLRLTRGEPHEYARTLASLEEVRLTAPQLALAATGGILLDRVRRIVGVPAPSRAATRPTKGLALLVATTLAMVAAFALQQDKLDDSAATTAVMKQIPAPAGLALRSLAARVPAPPEWIVKVAKPKHIALPGAVTATFKSEPARRSAVIVEAIPPTSITFANAGFRASNGGGLASIADIPVAAPKIAAFASVREGAPATTPVALRTIAPRYPDGIAASGPISIAVSFGITREGRVYDIHVLPSSANAAFATAAQTALANWRFDPASIPAYRAARFQQTFVFSKEQDQRLSRSAVAEDLGCVPRTGSLICRHEREEKVPLPLTIIRLTDSSGSRASNGG